MLTFEAPGDAVTLVARSEAMRRRVALALRAATGDIPVLLTGESGTGKDLLARAIHAGSRRAERAFVAVNCAAIPDGLLEKRESGKCTSLSHSACRAHIPIARTGPFVRPEGSGLCT